VAVAAEGIRNPPNDSALDTDAPGARASDLSITKSAGVTSYTPGGTLTYTIAVGNAGPSDAAGVVVSDPVLALPQVASASWTCVAAGGATCAAGPVAGDLSDTISIPVGGSETYTLQLTLKPGASGDLANQASVAVATGAAIRLNDTAVDTDTAGPIATCRHEDRRRDELHAGRNAESYRSSSPMEGRARRGRRATRPRRAGRERELTQHVAGGARPRRRSDRRGLSDTISVPVGGSATLHRTRR
jgi:uncharacterized repeat protein (TIGR01451 family)